KHFLSAAPTIADDFLHRSELARSSKSCDRHSVAIGTRVTSRPPHRSVHEAFPHTAPTSGPNAPSETRCTHAAIACDMLNPAQCPEHALMTRIPLGLGPSLHQLRSRSLCLVRGLHSYYGSSVSGGIGSPCGPRSVRLYHPYKVADRRPCPHRPRRSRSRE